MSKLIIIMISVLFSSMVTSDQTPTTISKPNTVIEIVLFEAKAGYSEIQVKEALTSLNELVKLHLGFIERTTAITAEGKYVDIVYWTDMDAAKNAALAIKNDPEAAEIFKVINPESIQMFHFNSFNQFKE